MAWGRLDDKLHENAKVWQAGTAALGLWVLANSWCCDNWQTDGFVPTRVLRRWSDGSIGDDVDAVAASLVDAGLWHPAKQGREAGFLFHDWDQYRPESGRSSYDARRGNHVRWHANLGVSKPDCDFCAAEAVSPSQIPVDRGDIGAISGRIGGESLPEPEPEPEPTTSRASEDAPVEDNRFDEFWDVYDKKRDRKKCEQKYRLALKKRGVTADLLIDAAARYVDFQRRAGKHPEFTKDPATWLNGECWTNELVGTSRPTQVAPAPDDLFANLGRIQSGGAA